MLKYQEKDPNILKHAMKCGFNVLILATIVASLFGLSTYIINGFEYFNNALIKVLSYTFQMIVYLGNHVNKTAILCSMWISFALVIWSLCVMLKVKNEYKKSKKHGKELIFYL